MLIREAYKNNCPLYRTYGPTSSYGFPRSWEMKNQKTSVVHNKRAKERSGKVHRELHILCLSGTQQLIANYGMQHLKKFYVIPLHVSENIIALRTVNLKELRKILSEINLWTLKGKSLCMFEKPVVHSNCMQLCVQFNVKKYSHTVNKKLIMREVTRSPNCRLRWVHFSCTGWERMWSIGKKISDRGQQNL